jgi:hypothetical protein
MVASTWPNGMWFIYMTQKFEKAETEAIDGCNGKIYTERWSKRHSSLQNAQALGSAHVFRIMGYMGRPSKMSR